MGRNPTQRFTCGGHDTTHGTYRCANPNGRLDPAPYHGWVAHRHVARCDLRDETTQSDTVVVPEWVVWSHALAVTHMKTSDECREALPGSLPSSPPKDIGNHEVSDGVTWAYPMSLSCFR
jgi:hypothetical protein